MSQMKIGLPLEISNLTCPAWIWVGAKAKKVWKGLRRKIFLKIRQGKSLPTVYFIKLIIKVVWWRRVIKQTPNIPPYIQLRRDRSRAFHVLRNHVKYLYDTIDSGNDADKQTVLDKIQNELWPKFVNISLQYSEAVSSIPQSMEHDLLLQNNALELMARSLFTAG